MSTDRAPDDVFLSGLVVIQANSGGKCTIGAYLVGEFLNAYVLAKLKLALGESFLALRLIASTVLGQGVNVALLLKLAFGSVFTAVDLGQLAFSVWAIKVA